MSYEKQIVEKKDIINSLFLNNLKYVNEVSSFVMNSLQSNWNNYVLKNNNKYLDKILKNLDKLSSIENKRFNQKDIEKIKNENQQLIKHAYDNKISRYIRFILEKINNINALSELLFYYVDLYNSEIQVVNKKIVSQNPVSVKKKSKIVSSLINGKIYLHVDYFDNKMSFNSNSLKAENDNYLKALSNKKKLFFEIYDVNLSSYEKKREIYINEMYLQTLSLVELFNKKIDITFPVDKVFDAVIGIVDNLYKEIINYDNSNSVLSLLLNRTIDSYGSKYKINIYLKGIEKLYNSIENVDKYIVKELKDSVELCLHSSKYRVLSNISNLFPMLDDIYFCVNIKIKKYINKNINLIMKNIELLEHLCKYMSKEDIIELYYELRDVLYYEKYDTKYLIHLQKIFVFMFKNKYQLSEEKILRDYFKENKLY